MNIDVQLKVLEYAADLYPNGAVPVGASPGSAAVDLLAADDAVIRPGETVKIRTGLRMHMLMPMMCALVLPRSGLGAKEGVVLGNTAGLIDNDYQGDIDCYIFNRNPTSAVPGNWAYTPKMVRIQRGMRFAQMMFLPFVVPTFTRVDEFMYVTERGDKGFGSSGA